MATSMDDNNTAITTLKSAYLFKECKQQRKFDILENINFIGQS